MTRIITHSELLFEDFRDPFACPDGPAETKGFGTAFQQARYLRSALPGETGRRTGFGAGSQSVFASVSGASDPLTDGSLRDTEGGGDFVLLPVLLMQVPGAKATIFTPIVCL